MSVQHKPASLHGSPAEAQEAPPEEYLYVAAMRAGTGVDAPDLLAVVDTRPESDTYGQIVHETPMPYVGDELHHFGWNRCSSACHGPDRSHLIVPGFRSSRVYVVNVADDPLRPQIEKVIEPDEIERATGYTRPHTTHCMPGDNVVISMLGDVEGNSAGGFAVIDGKTFEVKGRWENGGARPPMNYDFWYQPRKNVLGLERVRRTECLRAGLRPRRRRGRLLRTAAPLLEPRAARARADDRPRRERARPARDPLEARSRSGRGLRRSGAVVSDLALPPRERVVRGRAGGRGRPRRS